LQHWSESFGCTVREEMNEKTFRLREKVRGCREGAEPCMKWAIALIRCTCSPAVEDQWNSSGVRDKNGGILQG